MNVNLNKAINHKDVDVGDVVVFERVIDFACDYYLIVENESDRVARYQLMSLESSTIRERYVSISDMITVLKSEDRNGYRLSSIIKSNDIQVSRVAND